VNARLDLTAYWDVEIRKGNLVNAGSKEGKGFLVVAPHGEPRLSSRAYTT
jgi:hypothetical protein